ARHVQQDRGRRPSVGRTEIDAREQDQRAGGPELRRHAQQHRHRADRPDAREHADQRAQHDADHRKHQERGIRERGEAGTEIVPHARPSLRHTSPSVPAGNGTHSHHTKINQVAAPNPMPSSTALLHRRRPMILPISTSDTDSVTIIPTVTPSSGTSMAAASTPTTRHQWTLSSVSSSGSATGAGRRTTTQALEITRTTATISGKKPDPVSARVPTPSCTASTP